MANRRSPERGDAGFEEIPAATYGYQYDTDDSINVSDMFSKLWRRKGLIVIGLALSLLVGLAAAIIAHSRTSTASFVEYYISLVQINDSRYPNGTEFSPQDLLSPEVLNTLSDEIDIADKTALRNAISVEFNSPISVGVTEKYRSRLTARGLSAAEIDTINNQFTEELDRLTAASLRLSINPGELAIDNNLARQALIRIPEIWADVFTKNFRILDDKRIQSIKINLSEQLFDQIGIVETDRQLEELQSGLTILNRDNRLSALLTANGNSPAYLAQQVRNFRDLYLSPILASRLSGDGFLARFYVNDLKLDIAEINAELETINDIVTDLQSLIDRQERIDASDGDGNSGASVDIDGSALNSIVALANQASLADYLTTLFEQRRSLVRQKSELTTKIRRASSNVEIDQPFLE